MPSDPMTRLRGVAHNPQANHTHSTARAIIEARLGRKLPHLRAMAPDEREAVKRLAIELVRNRRTTA